MTVLGLIFGLATMVTTGVAAAESYDITSCGASTITTVSSSSDLTVLLIDGKGIARSNPEKAAFDNTTYHCVSTVRILGGQRAGNGFCKYVDTDGDAVVGEFSLGATEGTWKFLEGTGKWKGIKGGGKNMVIASGKPIVPGTAPGLRPRDGHVRGDKVAYPGQRLAVRHPDAGAGLLVSSVTSVMPGALTPL